jgi:integrase
MATMTDKGIAAAIREAKACESYVWINDETKQRGIGRLRLRVSPSGGCAFYFRYSRSDGRQDSYPVGTYDPIGKAGKTLKEARDRAGELSRLFQDGHRDLRKYLDEKYREEERRIAGEQQAREEAERLATAGSLQDLMDAYISHLKRQGKVSEQDARNIFKRNVTLEFPELAAKRAADITHRDISAILAKLISRTAGRTAAKLRSYLRAAFAEALAAEGEPTAHPDLHGFNLNTNPVAQVSAKKLNALNRARERTLTEAELCIFLRRLEQNPSIKRDEILLSLYLGGQRSEQLLRLTPSDVDLDARVLTLYDGKGARQTARTHLLPITDRAAEIVERLLELNGGKRYLFTLNGKVSISKGLLQKDIVRPISAAMVAEKLSPIPFQYSDLRRTCETMMARMKIDKETRAHILSHGLGGVQNQHYNKYDYFEEKKSALEAWDEKLGEIKKRQEHNQRCADEAR